jgi:hypothetical protein
VRVGASCACDWHRKRKEKEKKKEIIIEVDKYVLGYPSQSNYRGQQRAHYRYAHCGGISLAPPGEALRLSTLHPAGSWFTCRVVTQKKLNTSFMAEDPRIPRSEPYDPCSAEQGRGVCRTRTEARAPVKEEHLSLALPHYMSNTSCASWLNVPSPQYDYRYIHARTQLLALLQPNVEACSLKASRRAGWAISSEYPAVPLCKAKGRRKGIKKKIKKKRGSHWVPPGCNIACGRGRSSPIAVKEASGLSLPSSLCLGPVKRDRSLTNLSARLYQTNTKVHDSVKPSRGTWVVFDRYFRPFPCREKRRGHTADSALSPDMLSRNRPPDEAV